MCAIVTRDEDERVAVRARPCEGVKDSADRGVHLCYEVAVRSRTALPNELVGRQPRGMRG